MFRDFFVNAIQQVNLQCVHVQTCLVTLWTLKCLRVFPFSRCTVGLQDKSKKIIKIHLIKLLMNQKDKFTKHSIMFAIQTMSAMMSKLYVYKLVLNLYTSTMGHIAHLSTNRHKQSHIQNISFYIHITY